MEAKISLAGLRKNFNDNQGRAGNATISIEAAANGFRITVNSPTGNTNHVFEGDDSTCATKLQGFLGSLVTSGNG